MENRSIKYANQLSKLIQCETITAKNEQELEKFDDFHALLQQIFPTVFSSCSIEKFGKSLLLKWQGKSSENPIMLMNHHDVVEATGDWKYPPFSGTIAQDKIWGRGALDTKGGLWGMFCACEELIKENFTPSNDVYLLTTANEETTGEDADLISQTLKNRGIRFKFVLDEGGMIVEEPIKGAKGKFAMIGIGEKVFAHIKFIAKSNGGHASAPPKNSPLVLLGKFMAECDNTKAFKVHLSDFVIQMFKKIGASMSGYMKTVLVNASLFKGILKKVMPSISPVAGAMLKTTVAFTMANGSGATNVLPEYAYVCCDMRCSHHQGLEDSIAQISKIASKYGLETVVTQKGYESKISDPKAKEFELLCQTVSEIFPQVTSVAYVPNSASDCRFMDRVSDNCYRFSPFIISSEQLDGVHGIDENVDVYTLENAVDFYKSLIRKA